jgi:hypothetical protein
MKSDHALAVRDSLARRPQAQIGDGVQEAPGAYVGTDLATRRTRRPAPLRSGVPCQLAVLICVPGGWLAAPRK